MSIVTSRNPQTGITYVYSSDRVYDKDLDKYRYKRTVIGKLDENGNTVPTESRGGYHPKKESQDTPASADHTPAEPAPRKRGRPRKEHSAEELSSAELRSQLKESKAENTELKQQVLLLQKELAEKQKQLDHIRNSITAALAAIS